jgi:hypothetical protein
VERFRIPESCPKPGPPSKHPARRVSLIRPLGVFACSEVDPERLPPGWAWIETCLADQGGTFDAYQLDAIYCNASTPDKAAILGIGMDAAEISYQRKARIRYDKHRPDPCGGSHDVVLGLGICKEVACSGRENYG